MSISTHFIFEALPYDDSSYSCPTIDKEMIDDRIIIHVPTSLAKYLVLETIQDMNTSEYIDLDLERCIRDSFHPWYTLDSSLLDFSVGFHQYKMNFSSYRLHDNISLYFKYQIYSDKLDKPYIYMREDEDD